MTDQDDFILSHMTEIAERGVRRGRSLQAQECARMVRGAFRRLAALVRYLGSGTSLEQRLP